MTQPASEIYQIVRHDVVADSPSFWARLFARFMPAPGLGGTIVSVVHLPSGEEVFRHIEDLDDEDEDHVIDGLDADLASMTAAEFKARWG